MMRSRWIALVFFLCMILGVSEPSFGDTRINDFGSWNGVMLQGPFRQNFGYYLELQNRVNADRPDRNSFILRPALNYSLFKGFTVWLGYGWMPTFTPFRTENRLWQQMQYQENLDSWTLAGRFRFEERWLGNTSGVSLRSRVLVRAIGFVEATRSWGVCGWDEVFVHLNSISNGPSAGLDQNRFFLGVHFRVSESVQLEPGYLNVTVNQPNLMGHIFAIYTYVNF